MVYRRNWRLIFAVTIATIVYFVILGNVTIPSLKLSNENHKEMSFHLEKEFDFIIKHPTYEQIREYEQEDHIEDVTPFYRLAVWFSIGHRRRESNIDFFLEDDLTLSPYLGDRFIEGTTTLRDNEIIVDLQFISDHSAGLGDILLIELFNQEFEFEIIGISENAGGMMALYSDDVRNAVEASPYYQNGLAISGAFIKSSDITATRNFLDTEYKPLAFRRNRSEFDSDLAYSEHLSFLNTVECETFIVDIGEEVLLIKQQIEENEQTIEQLGLAGAAYIVFTISLYTVELLFRGRKNAKYQTSKRGGARGLMYKYLGLVATIGGLIILGILVGTYLITKTELYSYIPNLLTQSTILIQASALSLLVSATIIITIFRIMASRVVDEVR